MSIRMRRPETRRLEISQGDWLLVKKHLTAGETRRVMARMIKPGTEPQIDPVEVGISKMIAYLIDWSFQDANGKKLEIQDQPDSVVTAILNDIEKSAFAEVLKAIEDHERDMDAELEAEKKSRSIESSSLPSSLSASTSQDGLQTTSMTLTETSIQ